MTKRSPTTTTLTSNEVDANFPPYYPSPKKPNNLSQKKRSLEDADFQSHNSSLTSSKQQRIITTENNLPPQPTLANLRTRHTEVSLSQADNFDDDSSKMDVVDSDNTYHNFDLYCGGGPERRYRKGEIDGVILNLKRNRFLKVSGMNSHKSEKAVSEVFAATREAFYVDVDPKAPNKQERDVRIINTLPQKENTLFRVKEIKYGNHNAMWEVLSGQLYGLTGMTAPDTRFLVHEDYGTHLDGSPKVFVASPKISGYSDLGDFLINENILRFLPKTSRAKWQNLKEKIEAINHKSTENKPITATDKSVRVKLLGEIYEMMPDYFHTEIEKSFAASKFIANWDFANFDLNNIGCRFTLNREGEIIGFESVFVDFGNSGAIGFKGQYKDINLPHANKEAKSYVEKPKDYDPKLAFTPQERLLLQDKLMQLWEREQDLEESKRKLTRPINITNLHNLNLAATLVFEDLANNEASEGNLFSQAEENIRKSIRRKITHHIRESEAGMDIRSTMGLLTLSDLPRHSPFEILLKPAIKHKTQNQLDIDGWRIGEDPTIKNQTPNYDFYRESEIEMAFRLSLIPDAAIEHVVQKWFITEKFPEVFPIPAQFQDNPKYNSAAGVAQIFKERRDVLSRSIPPEIINQWIANHQIEALAAQQEVELAILKKTAALNQDFDFERNEAVIAKKAQEISINHQNSVAARVQNIHPVMYAKVIAREVEKHEISIGRTLKENHYDVELEALQRMRHVSNDPETIAHFDIQINQTHNEFLQKCRQSTIEFIEENIERWKQALGLKSKPNYDPFNLKAAEETFERTINSKANQNSRSVLSYHENLERNDKIHATNSFVYDRFMGILRGLFPSLSPNNPQTTQVASNSKSIWI